MTEKKDKPGQVIDFRTGSDRADTRRHERREAMARNLKRRFSTARRASESKTKAAERLKKIFKKRSRDSR